MGNIELKTYAGSNVTPQNDAIKDDTNTMNNGIYYGCNVTIKDATNLHITAGQGIIYGRVFEVVDSDIPVSLSSSGTLLGQLYVHIDLANLSAPAEILVDTGASLTPLEDDDQINIDSGITDMQLATFKVNTITLSDLAETFETVKPIRAVIGNTNIAAIGDGTVTGALSAINTQLNKGSISVTADGVKTYGTLMASLVSTIDWTKLNKDSTMFIGNGMLHITETDGATYANFVQNWASTVVGETVVHLGSPSTVKYGEYNGVNDITTSAPTNGTVIKIAY